MKAILNLLVLSTCFLFSTLHAEEHFHEDLDSQGEETRNLVHVLSHKEGQFALRLNEQGWLKILGMAMKYTSPKSVNTFTVPRNIYKLKMKKALLLSNPVVPIIDEITNLGLKNQKKDIPFYFETSDINITGSVNKTSLKTEFSNSHANGFDVTVSIQLPKITISSESMSLCLDKIKGKCDKGLRATMKGLRISTQKNPIYLKAKLRISNKNRIARVSLVSVKTNIEKSLEKIGVPTLDIAIRELIMPDMALEINGVTTELSTEWKDELMKHEAFMARELMSFAAEFSGKNLAKMINIYLVNTQIPTAWSLIDSNSSEELFREIGFEEEFKVPELPLEGRYVAPKVDASDVDVMKVLFDEIDKAIGQAKIDLALSSISAPGTKDLQIAAAVDLMLNGRAFEVKTTIHNSGNRTYPVKIEQRPYNPNMPARDNTYVRPAPIAFETRPVHLPQLDLAGYRNNDISIALSEPVLNGALDLVSSTGLIKNLFRALVKDHPELSLRDTESVRIHFSKDKTITAVANLTLDMTELSGFQNTLGRMLEWMNDTTQKKFPLEIDILPSLRQSDGKTELVLYVKSPFRTEKSLLNRFGYYSNVPNMVGLVKKGFLSKLGEGLNKHVDKEYAIDITKYLNQSGLEFNPKSISFDQEAYMILNLDIKSMKFDNLNPNKRK